MKFVHIADCHLGAWRDPKMRELTHKAWHATVDGILQEQPDFVVLAGDFFNTALPSIDSLKEGVVGLQRIKDAKIPVYCIGGSHDYSPSGKTILDVLEEAGLVYDVMRGRVEEGKLKLRWIEDPKTKIKLAGILGKKGSLDRQYYEDLDRESLEQEPGEKIFLFHTSISELKPKHLEQMEAQPASFLPKHCNYYAGGHVHIVADITIPGYTNLVYPGPIFPASFSELEKLKCGSYCVVEDWEMRRVYVDVQPTHNINIQGNSVHDIEEQLKKGLAQDINNKIVLIRISGEIDGSLSGIDFRGHFADAYARGAFFIMKNTNKLTHTDDEEIQVKGTPEELELTLLKEHLEDPQRAISLMTVLSQEVHEGEKKYTYEERVIAQAQKLISSQT